MNWNKSVVSVIVTKLLNIFSLIIIMQRQSGGLPIYIAIAWTNPSSISRILGSWLSNFDLKEKKYIMVQVATLCWTIWRCRNDLIFKNCKYIMVQVVALLLQHDDETIESFQFVSRKLETTALKLFTSHGWKFNNTRLCTIFVFLVFLIHQQIPLKLCN